MLVRQGYICVTVAEEGKNNFDGLKTTRPQAFIKNHLRPEKMTFLRLIESRFVCVLQ